MTTGPHDDAVRALWELDADIPLSGVPAGASWKRATTVATGEGVILFVVRGDAALEVADSARRAYLVEDPRLIPVQDVQVFGDPREDPSGVEDSPEPVTVVQYQVPPAAPLAAMFAEGPLRGETARSVIGEIAAGLDVARRRGIRHQNLDSNRVFVDPVAGTVHILGVGVEAAARIEEFASGRVASFRDTTALVALLYKALSGSRPMREKDGLVPRASAISLRRVPDDLDVLCDSVLNEADENIPETVRDLVAELEPWQSIPVTLEAYDPQDAEIAAAAAREDQDLEDDAQDEHQEASEDPTRSEGSAASGAVLAGGAAALGAGAGAAAAGTHGGSGDVSDTVLQPAVEHDAAPEDDPDTEDHPDTEATALLTPVPGTQDAEEASGNADAGTPDSKESQQSPESQESGAAGSTTAPATDESWGTAALGPVAPPDGAASAGEAAAAATGAAHAGSSDHDPSPDSSEAGRSGEEARTLIRDLHLDEPRRGSAFPGSMSVHPDVAETPVAPMPDPDAPEAGESTTVASPASPTASSTSSDEADDSTARMTAVPDGVARPPRSAGADLPTALTPPRESEDDDAEPRTARMAPVVAAPLAEAPDQGPAGPGESDSRSDDALDPAKDSGPAQVAEPAGPSGPIVVQGRDRSLAEDDAAGTGQRASLLRDVVGVAMDRDEPTAYTQTPVPREDRSRYAQWILAAAVLFVIIALVFAITSITSSLRGDRPAAVGTSAEETTAPEEPAEETTAEEETQEPLPAPTATSAEVFTRGSDSDPDHADEQDRIIDGDPESEWSTQIYATAEFGNLKEGAGVRLGFEEPGTITSVIVTTEDNSGGIIELRTDGGEDLGEVLATGEFAGNGDVTLTPEQPIEEASSVILWIPELPADSEDDGYRAHIAEVRVE